jgi:glycosyltransferase involved in cell wall biosynthesis
VVHGALDRARISALYHGADVFVVPSIREPYGTAYGEAMAAGLPVVGWRAENLPHLATHDREGLILPPGDIWRAHRRAAAAGQRRALPAAFG